MDCTQAYCTVHTQAGTHPVLTYIAKANPHKKEAWGWFWKVRSGRREKRLEALKATRAFLHYDCSVLKATPHVSCEATRCCYSAVWASSPSNINANHCSHSINIERKVQFTSDLFLMNLDGSKKNHDEYFWSEKTFSQIVSGHTAFNSCDLFLSTFSPRAFLYCSTFPSHIHTYALLI